MFIVSRAHTDSFGEQHTQPSGDLARLALYEQVDPLMLLTQLVVQLILEILQRLCFVFMTRDCNRLRLILGRVNFDSMLDIIVIDVIS